MKTTKELAQIAVSLPGWRWLPGMLALPPKADRCSRHGQVMTDRLPDPTDPATAGCLLALLGPARDVLSHSCGELFWSPTTGPALRGLGLACIAAAESIGHWPKQEKIK